MSIDTEFTAEQVARSMQADARQIQVLREYLANSDYEFRKCEFHNPVKPAANDSGEAMNCHVGKQHPGREGKPYTVKLPNDEPSVKAHEAMHELLQKRMEARRTACEIADIFDVPVTLIYPATALQPRAMDDLLAGEV